MFPAVLLATIALVSSASSARAEQYTAGGVIDAPNEQQVFVRPPGQPFIFVTGVTSFHAVSIFNGNAGQGIPGVSYQLELEMPGAHKIVTPQQAFHVTLDEDGEWSFDTSLSQSSQQIGVGDYKATLRSEIYVFGVSKADYAHSHDFFVR